MIAETDYHPTENPYGLHPILHRCGQWAVTEYGVECTQTFYAIEGARVHEPDWFEHMLDKGWVTMADFTAALRMARRLWLPSGKPVRRRPAKAKQQGMKRLRFRVLRRDRFKCQMCGRGAGDGVKLEIDHRYPRSKGGTNDITNLWTLCRDCNRGKGDLLLQKP